MSTTTELFKPYMLQTAPHVPGSTRSEHAAHKADGPLYKMSSNENMLGPSPRALEAIRASLHLLHEYSYMNDERFRAALAAHFNHSLAAGQFITANGGMELLDLVCRGFLEPGDECILTSPTFLAYKSFASVQGAKVIDVPLIDPSFDTDVDGILNAITPKTKLLFLGSPNNPTGTIIPRAQLDELMQFLPPHVVVVYDEVYFHYADNPHFVQAERYIKEGRNMIGLHSFSKAYGLAGLRLGYAFSSPQIAAYLSNIRRPFMINTLAMEAGMAALDDHEYLERTRSLVAREKKWLYRQFEELGIHYWKSEANFIMFKSPVPNTSFVDNMLQQGVMIRTGDAFKAPGCARVTIGTHEANNAFIEALKQVIATPKSL